MTDAERKDDIIPPSEHIASAETPDTPATATADEVAQLKQQLSEATEKMLRALAEAVG